MAAVVALPGFDVGGRVRRASAPWVWLAAAAVWALSVGSRWAIYPRYDDRPHLAEFCQALSAGAVLLTARVLARRQPDNRMWVLTLWFGVAGLLQDLTGPSSLLFTVGQAAFELPALMLVWMSSAFPTGRLTSRIDRLIVAWAAAITAVAACHVFVEGGHGVGGHQFRSLLYLPSANRNGLWPGRLETATLYLSVPGGVLFLGRLAVRAVRARRGPRRVSLPLLVAAIGATTWFLAQVPFVGSFSVTNEIVRRFFWFSLLIQVSIPAAFTVGALAERWNRSIVSELMLELDGAPPGSVQPALARALGDPALRVLLRRPDGSGYVTPGGEPVPWDPEGVVAPRNWTSIGTPGSEVAVVVYDAELDAQPALVRSTLAAARFALENERLHADLQAQMHELRASRARVVEASDAERRRIERNLHDGVQQRLYAVGMELDAARHALLDGTDAAARQRLEEADAALRTAIEDLRDVAQGIDPPVLTNRGLEAALRSRTRRSSVPVLLATTLTERLSAPIETAAYYVASEAFTNAERHADATRISIELRTDGGELVVTVADDGVGGADASKGTGLRGLLDRAQAFDGTLAVHSPVGGGTRVEVRLPLTPP